MPGRLALRAGGHVLADRADLRERAVVDRHVLLVDQESGRPGPHHVQLGPEHLGPVRLRVRRDAHEIAVGLRLQCLRGRPGMRPASGLLGVQEMGLEVSREAQGDDRDDGRPGGDGCGQPGLRRQRSRERTEHQQHEVPQPPPVQPPPRHLRRDGPLPVSAPDEVQETVRRRCRAVRRGRVGLHGLGVHRCAPRPRADTSRWTGCPRAASSPSAMAARGRHRDVTAPARSLLEPSLTPGSSTGRQPPVRDQGAKALPTPRSAGRSCGKCRSRTVRMSLSRTHSSPAGV